MAFKKSKRSAVALLTVIAVATYTCGTAQALPGTAAGTLDPRTTSPSPAPAASAPASTAGALRGARAATAGKTFSPTLPAPARVTAASGLAAALALAKKTGKPLVDVPSLRARFSDTTANPDGTYTKKVSPIPVNVAQPDGTFAPIVNTLAKVGAAVEPGRTTLGTALGVAGGQQLAAFSVAGHHVRISQAGVLPSPTLSGVTAIYPADVAGGGDLKVSSLSNGIELSIALKTRPSVLPAAWEFPINLGGLTPVKAVGGQSFGLTDSTSAKVGNISGVFVKDSTTPMPHLDGFTQDIVTTATGTVLRITPDAQYLLAPTTTYPVDIDPTVTEQNSTDGDDTFIWSQGAQQNTNWGGDPWLYAGTWSDGSYSRSLIKFPTSGWLNTGDTITSATLALSNADSYACQTSGEAPRMAIQRIQNRDIDQNVTWASDVGSNPVVGTDVSAVYDSYSEPKGCPISNQPGDYLGVDLTGTVQGWANGSYPNYGIQLITAENTQYSFRQFRSGNAGGTTTDGYSAGNLGQPILQVTYQSNQLPPSTDVTSATPHNGYAAINWAPTGGAPITPQNQPDSYLIALYNADNAQLMGTVSVGGSLTSAGVQYYNANSGGSAALANGQNVTFYVYAHNDNGYASPGTGQTALIQGYPSAVYGPDGTAATPPAVTTGDSTVTATWTQGNLNGARSLGQYVAFLYPLGQQWPANTTAYCTGLTSPTVTFGPGTLPSNCAGTAPVNGTTYDVEVFEQNQSGDGYPGGTDTSNTALPASFGPPATSGPVIVGLPSITAGVTAIAGNGAAIVYWSAAADNGNAVSTYTVTASPGGATVTTDGDVITAFPDLTNGTSYSFTVTPTNAIGTGAASSSSNIVIPVAGGLNVTTTLETAWAVNFAQAYGARVPIISLATSNSNTFAEADGTLTTEISPTTSQVTASDGSYQGLDANLVQDGSTYRPAVSAMGETISSGGGTQIDTISDPAGHNATFSWPTTLPAPTVNGDTATYPNAAPNTDLLVRSLPDGVDHSLSVKSATPGSYTLHLDLSSGLTASLDSGNNLIIADTLGNPIYSGPPATMHDAQINADSDEPSNPGSVTTTLAPALTGGYNLTITPDPSYLLSSSTVYPVTIDPPVAASQDTYLQKASPKTAQGGNTVLKAGTYNNGTDVARPLLQFNTASFTGKTISKALLQLTNTHSWDCVSKPVTVYRVTQPWKTSTATWAAGSNGETPSIDSSSGIISQPFAAGDTCAGGPAQVKLAVTAIVQSWVSGTANDGLEIRSNETDNTAWKVFASTEAGGDQAPKLLVSQAAPANPTPPPGKPTMPAPSKKPASQKLWGLDSTSLANGGTYTSAQNGYNSSGFPPDFYGQYLGGTAGGNPALTAQDISYLHGKKSKTWVIDAYLGRVRGSTQPYSSYAEGLADGQVSIKNAQGLKDSRGHGLIPQGSTITADVENPNNSGTVPVDPGWVEGYYNAFKQAHFVYRPGFYYNAGATGSADFGGAYCSGNTTTDNGLTAGEIDKNSILYTSDTGDPNHPYDFHRSGAPSIAAAPRLHCPGKFTPGAPAGWQYSFKGPGGVDVDVQNGAIGNV